MSDSAELRGRLEKRIQAVARVPDILRVGFTGSRRGMALAQREALIRLILEICPDEFHHGCCIGSDTEAHGIARATGLSRIVGHPPVKTTFLGTYDDCDELRQPLPYLVRNRQIVDETDVLIATPRDPRGTPRSGTWYTVAYAEKQKRKVYILDPPDSVTPST